jgi:hypothetical protein
MECRSRAARAVTPVLAVIVGALALPGVAHGAPPAITSAPTITGYTGTPVVGDTLRAEGATWTGGDKAVPAYSWYRCPSGDGKCDAIQGAEEETYQLVALDAGHRIYVQLVVTKDKETSFPVESPRTDVVAARPAPIPEPDPEPEPVRPPSPTPTLAPLVPVAVFEVQPSMAPNTMPPPAAQAVRRPAYLRPFPIVRIRGYFARGGVRITLLSVRGPRAARVRARCTGAGCPVRAVAASLPPIRLRAFERFLPAGTVIRVRVTGGTRIGKYVRFTIRANRPPLRADRCLMPAGSRPVRCPS